MAEPMTIMTALERLPVLDAKRIELPAAAQILGLSHLVLSSNDLPSRRKGGTKKAVRMLDKLEKKLRAVIDCIDSIPSEGHRALSVEIESRSVRGMPHHHQFRDYASVLQGATEAARNNLSSTSAEPAEGARKAGAAGTSDVALRIFENLTGQDATRRTDAYDHDNGYPAAGPFIDFLEDVFDALGIAASYKSQAKDAIARARLRKKAPAI